MKILQICNRVPFPPKDGGTIVAYNTLKYFHESGNEVDLLAMNSSNHFLDINKLSDSFLTYSMFYFVNVNTEVKPFDALMHLLKGKSYNISRFISKDFTDTLTQILMKNKFDIVHLDGLYVTPYIETIRQYSDAKIVYRAHNVEHLIWKRMAENAFIGLRKIYLNILASQLKKYEQQQLNKFDLVVAITPNDEQLLRELGCKAPVIVSPAGLEMEKYKLDNSKEEFPSLFHLGGLDWMPNQEGLLWLLKNVWNQINKQFPELKFYIAGRNMPAWMKKLKFPNVEMLGEVEDAVKFMNTKSIMIVPLLSGGGMRIKIIEGMAMGKAIISTTVGAEGIAYSHGKNIFIADRKDEFEKYISQCVEDKLLCQKIGKAARELAITRYDNKIVMKELVDYYKNRLL